MNLVSLVIFIILSIGIVNISQNESIFSIVRAFLYERLPKIYAFVTCPTCFGFWIGVSLSFFFDITDIIYVNMFFGGIISSISNKLYARFIPEGFSAR